MIIHFNGMPGVGKLTIARILAEKLDATLIDILAMSRLQRVIGMGARAQLKPGAVLLAIKLGGRGCPHLAGCSAA